MIEPSRLKKYSLFGGLLDEQIERILPFLETETYRAGEKLITEGAPNDKIRFILEGRVAITVRGAPLDEFGTGETVGEMEVLDVMPSAATITALCDTRVISISNKNLHRIYKLDLQCFSLMIMNLARDLSRRLRRMDARFAATPAAAAPATDL